MSKLAIAILLVAVHTSAAEPPLEVRLELSPSNTLPGIPVSLRLTFTNRGSQTVQLPGQAALWVKDENGASFLPSLVKSPHALDVKAWKNVRITPGQSVLREIASDGTLFQPGWFADLRLMRVGLYQVQVWLGDGLRDGSEEGWLPGIDELRQRTTPSTTAVLTVAEPRGADGEVLSWLRAGSGELGWYPGATTAGPEGRALAKRILSVHPDSAYVPWVATMGASPDFEDSIGILRDWLAAHPGQLHDERRRLRLAEIEIVSAGRFHEKQPEKARKYEGEARSILKALIRDTRSEEVRQIAKEKLDYLDEPEETDD